MIRGDREIDVEQLRSLFPVTAERAYLFHGNIAPCAQPVAAAVTALLDVWSRTGDGCWDRGMAHLASARARFARLVGSRPELLATVPNTSAGIALAAKVIDPAPGSNVVVDELSHASNTLPWLALRERGVEVRHARADGGRIPLAEYERLVDARTAAIDVCHVSMSTGFRCDLAALRAIAAAHGAALVVDAAQSAGAVPIDLASTPADFLVAPTFKWLLGPLGAGFLHVDEAWIERVAAPPAGWRGAADPLDLQGTAPRAGAERLEGGVPALLAWAGADAGLELLEQLGFARVHARIAALSERLDRGLRALAPAGVAVVTPQQPAARAGIVAFDVPGRAAVHAGLEAAGFHVGDWCGHIRVDTAVYTTEAELDGLLAHLAQLLDAI